MLLLWLQKLQGQLDSSTETVAKLRREYEEYEVVSRREQSGHLHTRNLFNASQRHLSKVSQALFATQSQLQKRQEDLAKSCAKATDLHHQLALERWARVVRGLTTSQHHLVSAASIETRSMLLDKLRLLRQQNVRQLQVSFSQAW